MGALAENWVESDLSSKAEQAQAARAAKSARSGRSGARGDVGDGSGRRWNVLAEELVSYPPRQQRIWLERSEEATRSRAYADAWLEGELERLARRRVAALAKPGPSPRTSGTTHLVTPPSPSPQSPPATGVGLAAPAPRRARKARQSTASVTTGRPKTRPVAAGPRGLARLLPGVAALAVLGLTWFGVGALAGAAHGGPIERLTGSVAVPGGYSYVVQPGDTLWSIASRVEPGRDPRALVDHLEQEIGGDALQPGERLLLPR